MQPKPIFDLSDTQIQQQILMDLHDQLAPLLALAQNYFTYSSNKNQLTSAQIIPSLQQINDGIRTLANHELGLVLEQKIVLFQKDITLRLGEVQQQFLGTNRRNWLFFDEINLVLQKAQTVIQDIFEPKALAPHQLINLVDILTVLIELMNKASTVIFEFKTSNQTILVASFYKTQVESIVLELSKNCIKHAIATKAIWSIVQVDEGIYLKFKDNGTGIKTSNSKGMGLKNMAKRVADLHGNIDFVSEPTGFGAEIWLPLP